MTGAGSSSPSVAGSAHTRKYRRRQEAIVRAAVEVLNCKGVKGMTLADVADKLQLVPTGIIYYFPNKEELTAACLFKAIEVHERLIAEAAQAPTAELRLAGLVRRYIELRRSVATGAADPTANFAAVRALNHPIVNDAYVDLFRHLRALMAPDPPAKIDRPVLNARTHHVLCQLHWAIGWLPRYDPNDYSRASDCVVDILLHGVGAADRAWAPTPLPALAAEDTDEVSRETFLRAATELINVEGYRGASVQKISAQLNVTKGSFYYHNEAKDDLVVACFERTVKLVHAAQQAADDLTLSGWDRLCSATAALVEAQVFGRTPLLRTTALTSLPEAIQTPETMKFDLLYDHFAAVIRDGIADGSIRPIDADIGAHLITGMLNAAGALSLYAKDLAPERAVRTFVQPFFEGLLAPADGP